MKNKSNKSNNSNGKIIIAGNNSDIINVGSNSNVHFYKNIIVASNTNLIPDMIPPFFDDIPPFFDDIPPFYCDNGSIPFMLSDGNYYCGNEFGGGGEDYYSVGGAGSGDYNVRTDLSVVF